MTDLHARSGFDPFGPWRGPVLTPERGEFVDPTPTGPVRTAPAARTATPAPGIPVLAAPRDRLPAEPVRRPATSTPATPTPAAPGPAASPVATRAPAGTPGRIAPAWYADPAGRFRFRYWDGATWTDHVSHGGAHAAVVPLYPAASGARRPKDRRAARPSARIALKALLAGLVTGATILGVALLALKLTGQVLSEPPWWLKSVVVGGVVSAMAGVLYPDTGRRAGESSPHDRAP